MKIMSDNASLPIFQMLHDKNDSPEIMLHFRASKTATDVLYFHIGYIRPRSVVEDFFWSLKV